MWVLIRPFVYLWAGLNVIDSIGFGTRVARLLVGTLLHQINNNDDSYELCSVCDDVMGDLLAGNDGLSAIPCQAACFRQATCIHMCEIVQEASATSTEFPCVAAGFCPDFPQVEEDEDEETLLTTCQNQKKPWQCQPKRYCHRVRHGLKFSCELRPGIKRWTGMKQMATKHTVALARGLVSQKHCTEPDAGPYCIARPQTAIGRASDIIANILAILVGGYKSVHAIESPGTDDDRQWLIFWLILTIMFSVENYFARVLLSNFTFYFEMKLLALIWLIWWEGADVCYRRLKQFLQSNNFILHYHESATVMQKELQRMHQLLGEDIMEEKRRLQSSLSTRKRQKRASLAVLPKVSLSLDWDDDPDYDGTQSLEWQAMQELVELSVFLLSAEGAAMLANFRDKGIISKHTVDIVLEKAAACASFQPRYLNIHLIGTTPTDPIPTMDSNGLADPYVVFRLIPPPTSTNNKPYPAAGLRSRICFKTLNPLWDQRLELQLRGGEQDSSGYYQSQTAVGSTQLNVFVYDADVGIWSVLYHFFKILVSVSGIFMWALPKLPKSMILKINNSSAIWMTKDTLQILVRWAVVVASVGYGISYIMAVIQRSDDEPIGECLIPLSILMDQEEHALLLTLRSPSTSSPSETEEARQTDTDSGKGVIRVKLSLSEN